MPGVMQNKERRYSMPEILIILSSHKERGPFKASKLQAILDKEEPQVVYLEASKEEYSEFETLESIAVKAYAVKKNISIIPAGLSKTKEEIYESFQRYNYLSKVLETYSTEQYRELYDRHLRQEDIEGFNYLHSEEYGITQNKLHLLEEQIVRATGSKEYMGLYRWWVNLQDEREVSMLNQVTNHLANASYEKAVLIIGSEHRNSVLEKVKTDAYRDLQWTIYIN